MKLCNIGHNFNYELEKLIRIFLPFEKIVFCDTVDEDEKTAIVKREKKEDKTVLSAWLLLKGLQSYSHV